MDRELLIKVYIAWETDRRAGKCLPQDVVDGTPIERAAENLADALLGYVEQVRAAA